MCVRSGGLCREVCTWVMSPVVRTNATHQKDGVPHRVAVDDVLLALVEQLAQGALFEHERTRHDVVVVSAHAVSSHKHNLVDAFELPHAVQEGVREIGLPPLARAGQRESEARLLGYGRDQIIHVENRIPVSRWSEWRNSVHDCAGSLK